MYASLRCLMRLMVSVYLFGLISVEGRQNVPRRGGLLVCSNHRSTIDPPLLPAYLPRGDSWSMAKAEFFAKRNFTNWLFTTYHGFPVIRHTADRTALKRSFRMLDAGECLIVYPEGTRVDAGGLIRGEPGAGYLAQRSQAPVLPVALLGTQECFPKGAKWPRRVRVKVIFGQPFTLPARYRGGQRVDPQDAADAIMLSIAELLPPGGRGEYADLDRFRERVGSLRVPLERAEPVQPRLDDL